jgi:hypothetical protein
MFKKIFIFVLFLALTSCGFEPIYSKKNSDIVINKLELNGDKKINRKIISSLNIKEIEKSELGYKLTLDSNKLIEIVSKDKNGNASIYKTTLDVDISLSKEGEIVRKKKFNLSFSYNNMKNKFDLSEYQKNIESNLISKITEEIFIFLNL